MILPFLILSCEAIPEPEFTDRPVVCCYLASGESPVLTVQRLIPFKNDVTFSTENVEELDITITDLTTGEEYLLNSIGDGTYANESLMVSENHEYRLDFEYDNLPVTATTTVPDMPKGVSFSASYIEVMSFQPPSTSEVKAPQNGITVSWENEAGDYYIIEGKTNSSSTIRELDEDEELPSKSFKLNYTQGESATLASSDFNYYGSYTVSLIHICPEYAVLSQGGSTTSATLVDVRGNIDGGYGIFTGISYVNANIRVVEGSSPF